MRISERGDEVTINIAHIKALYPFVDKERRAVTKIS